MNKKPEIRKNYSPTDKERQALDWVYKRKRQLEAARSNHAFGNLETIWDNQMKQWEARREDVSKEEWQSDIYIPITTSIIESQLAEVIDKSPKPYIEPVNPEDTLIIKPLSVIFDHVWHNSRSDIEHFLLLKSSFIHGTGIWQESFLDVRRKVKDLVKFDPDKGIMEYEEREMKEYYDPFGETVNLFDFYPDDKGRYFYSGPYSCRDAIRRYVMHIDDFQATFTGPIWDPLKNAKYVKPGGDTEYYEFFKPPKGLDGEEVEVLWYWSRYPDDRLVIVANDVVMLDSPNPYKHKQLPFSRAIDYFRPNQFYGKGEADLLGSLQEELNTLRRMRLDRSHLDLDKMFLVSNRETLDDEDLIARPHGMIPVDDINSIKPIEYSNVDRSAYLEEDRMKEDAVRVTGVDDRFQSVQTGGTATETAILRESTLKRIRLKMRLHEKMFLPRMAEQRIANIQQYYSVPMAEAILDDQSEQDYRLKLSELEASGRLSYGKDGKPFETKYRTIPLKNKRLRLDKATNQVYEEPTQGWTFFEARPEYIRGNVNVRFEIGSSISISRPLEQQRKESLFQHPLFAAALQQGIYDLGKAADSLLEVHDLKPEEFKLNSSMDLKTISIDSLVDPREEIDLATEQNELIMSGQEVPPTPYITPRHVVIHLAFIQSDRFKQAADQDKKLIDNMIDHVTGEIAIIKERDDLSAQQQVEPMSPPAMGAGVSGSIGGPNPEGELYPASAIQPSPAKVGGADMGAVAPGRMMGGADAQQALPR